MSRRALAFAALGSVAFGAACGGPDRPTRTVVIDGTPLATSAPSAAPAPTATCTAPTTSTRFHLKVSHADRGKFFRVIHARYELDGVVLAELGGTNGSSVPDPLSVVVFDGDLASGCHRMVVTFDYFTRNPTPWGYDRAVRMTSTHEIALTSDLSVRAISVDDRGSVTTPLENRFAMTWDESP